MDRMKAAGMCVHGNFPTTCKICNTTSSAPENTESLYEQRFEAVKRARKHVEIAALLDAYLEIPSDHSWEDFEDFLEHTCAISVKEIPESLRTRFQGIITEWTHLSRAHKNVEKSLEELAQRQGRSISPENMGIIFYQGTQFIKGQDILQKNPEYQLHKEAPEAPISVRMEGPYLAVYVPDDYDHEQIGGTPGSGGTFHRSESITLRYEDRELNPNILIIKSKSDTEEAENTRTHERQHFINHAWMKKEAFKDLKTVKEEWMKDEILAFIKDGSSPQRIYNGLTSTLYEHLYAGLDEKEKEELKHLLKQTTDALKEARGWFPTNITSMLLVYHLIDLPLSRFPETLKLLTEFEKAKYNAQTDETPALTFKIPHKEEAWHIGTE